MVQSQGFKRLRRRRCGKRAKEHEHLAKASYGVSERFGEFGIPCLETFMIGIPSFRLYGVTYFRKSSLGATIRNLFTDHAGM